MKKDMKQRILEKHYVDDNGCWIWTGRYHRSKKELLQGKKNYGTIEIYDSSYKGKKRKIRAHRASYEAFHGLIPAGLYVCHSCDVPLCVNPEHLWLGTAKDNSEDMIKKGRSLKGRPSPLKGKPSPLKGRKGISKNMGSQHPRAKLTEEQVLEIRSLHSTKKLSYVDLARQFKVSDNLIGKIVRRERWPHLL